MRTEGWLDACGHLPDDLWTAGTLELLKTKTYMPSPAEMIEVVGKRFTERERMLLRARSMLPSTAPKAPATAFVAEPLEHRLRHAIWRGWEAKTGPGHFMAAKMWEWGCRAERELAGIEQREPAGWAAIEGGKIITVAEVAPKLSPSAVRTRDRLAELALRNRGGLRPVPNPEPPAPTTAAPDGYDAVPEGENFEAAA